jgi:hypothetical protein
MLNFFLRGSQFCDVAKMANDLQEYLAKFVCKLNVKVNLVKYLHFYFGYLLKQCIEKSGKFL